MCGRYSQTQSLKALQGRFGFKETHLELRPRYNLAPAQKAPVVIDEGQKTLKLMRWGLVPSWSKEGNSSGFINARAETLAQKPSFKKPFERQRCLVLADGFYEWAKAPGFKRKIPMRFVLKSREPFAMAGIWDRWVKSGAEGFQSFSIITTAANGLIGPHHERMPVILKPQDEDLWLDPGMRDAARLLALLTPYPPAEMEAWEVSSAVNSPFNDAPECLIPVSAVK